MAAAKQEADEEKVEGRELFSPTFPLRDGSCSGLNDQLLIPQGI
jgi:hypothetical protein